MKKLFLMLLCGTLMLSGCGNDEKEARTLLNQAIRKWDTGELEQADALFQKIENEYLATAVATESIKERQERYQKYKENINLNQVKQLNKGSFSKQVVQALTVYQQKNQQYPDALTSLKIANNDDLKPFLVGCDYKKALFNAGYSLNCLEADSEFDKKQREENYSKRRKQLEAERNKPKELESFPKAQKTFARLFNPTNTVPKSGFFAYYFRMSEPGQTQT